MRTTAAPLSAGLITISWRFGSSVSAILSVGVRLDLVGLTASMYKCISLITTIVSRVIGPVGVHEDMFEYF